MRERAKRHSLVEHPPKNAKWHSPSVGARIAPDPAGQRVLPPPDGLSLGQDIDACGSGRVCDSGNRSRTDGCRPDGRLQRTLKTGSGQQQAVDTGEVESWLRGEQRAFLTLWERLWEWLRRCSRNWLSRLQNSLGCGLNSRFPGEHSVVLDCRLRVLGREDSSGEPRSVERRPSTCLHRHRWMTGPGRAPALDRRLADDTLFVTSPGARAGRRSAPARRTCSGTSPLRRRGRGHGDRRTRP